MESNDHIAHKNHLGSHVSQVIEGRGNGGKLVHGREICIDELQKERVSASSNKDILGCRVTFRPSSELYCLLFAPLFSFPCAHGDKAQMSILTADSEGIKDGFRPCRILSLFNFVYGPLQLVKKLRIPDIL